MNKMNCVALRNGISRIALIVLGGLSALAPQAACAQASDTSDASTSATPDDQSRPGPKRQGPRSVDDADPNDIIVTARKRAERLRDVPSAGSAFDAAAIRDVGGIPTAQQLLANVPAVNFGDTSMAVTGEIAIRGSGTARATSASGGVGLYRDGAYVGGGGNAGSRTLSNIDFFDVGRIEVLRGVQGGLSGRNAVGGAINVYSAQPADNHDGYAMITVANNQRFELEAATNIPIGGGFSARVGAAGMTQRKGFYYEPYQDDYIDKQSKLFFRGQLNYSSATFTANILAEHGEERLPGLQIVPIVYANAATFPQGLPVDKKNFPFNSPNTSNQNVDSFELTTSTQLGFATLATTSMYRERYTSYQYDRDGSSPQARTATIAAGLVAPAALAAFRAQDLGLTQVITDRTKLLFQDVHLTGDKIGGFNWLLGGEYYLARNSSSNLLGRTPTTANPSPGTIDPSTGRFESFAGYASLSYDLSTKFTVAGDIRYTDDSRDVDTTRINLLTGAVTAAFKTSASRHSTNLSYTVTASYKPTTDWMLYAKLGTGYRSGGFNTAKGDPRQPIAIPPSYDNETLTAYEIGAKGNIKAGWYFAVAAYLNDYSNTILQRENGCNLTSSACPVSSTVFAFNGGPAKLWGVEAETSFRKRLFGGAIRSTLGVGMLGGHITGGVYNGLRQPQQPDWTFTGSVSYEHVLSGDVSGFFNLRGNARTGGVQEIAQVPPLDNYYDLDGEIGIKIKNVSFSAYANNLTNNSYYVYRAIADTGLNDRYNLPRTYGLRVRADW